jgi:hypothetical protein
MPNESKTKVRQEKEEQAEKAKEEIPSKPRKYWLSKKIIHFSSSFQV